MKRYGCYTFLAMLSIIEVIVIIAMSIFTNTTENNPTDCNCQSILFYEEFLGLNIWVPFFPLNRCASSRKNGIMYSYMLSTDEDNQFVFKGWNNSECEGNIDPDVTLDFLLLADNLRSFNKISPKPHNHRNESIIDLCLKSGKCKINNVPHLCDYVMGRIFNPNSCNNSYNDFIDEPGIVNQCIHMPESRIYVQNICTNSSHYLSIYAFKSCVHHPVFQHPLLDNSDDPCIPNTVYKEITYCSNSIGIDNGISSIIEYIAPIILLIAPYAMSLVLSFIVSLCVFKNFFEWQWKCGSCISFSDRHNWIIEPSSKNKVFALIGSFLYFITTTTNGLYACFTTIPPLMEIMSDAFVDNWPQNDTYMYSLNKMNTFKGIYLGIVSGLIFFNTAIQICYVWFNASVLEYYIDQEELIRNAVSPKSIKWTKRILTLIIIARPFFILKFPKYSSISGLLMLMILFISKSCFLYFYYKGFNNVAHWWASKQWQEYEKHNENEKTHEIWICITRVTVIMILSIFIDFISVQLTFIDDKFINEMNYPEALIVSVCISIADSLRYILLSLSIYFIYPFSHKIYEKCCGICNKEMYEFCKERHQRQVKFGAFDGTKYRDDLCCCCNNIAPCENEIELQYVQVGNSII